MSLLCEGNALNELRAGASVFDPDTAQNFQAFPARVIHQKQRHAIISNEIPRRKHLPVALVVGKSQCLRPQNTEKSGAPSAMLDIRPAGFGNARHVKTIASLNKNCFLFREDVPLRRAFEVTRGSVVSALRLADRIGEGEFKKFTGHIRKGLDFGGARCLFRCRLKAVAPKTYAQPQDAPLTASPIRLTIAGWRGRDSSPGQRAGSVEHELNLVAGPRVFVCDPKAS